MQILLELVKIIVAAITNPPISWALLIVGILAIVIIVFKYLFKR